MLILPLSFNAKLPTLLHLQLLRVGIF